MENQITLTGFSDEICPGFKEQLKTINEFGLKYIEIRGVDGKNISTLSPEEVCEVKSELDNAGIKVSAIGSPIGKVDINEDFQPHFELFQKMVDYAKILDSKYIRIFSFYPPKGETPEKYHDEIVKRLSSFIAYAKEHDIILLHENEKDIYGDAALRCQKLFKELYCPNFQGIFDFANFVECGEDTNEAFSLLQPYISYIHIKDAVKIEKMVVPPGDGDGNLPEILSKLKNSGYKGFLSLEPHLSNFIGLSDLEKDNAKRSNDIKGRYAWSLALKSLKSILWDINWR